MPKTYLFKQSYIYQPREVNIICNAESKEEALIWIRNYLVENSDSVEDLYKKYKTELNNRIQDAILDYDECFKKELYSEKELEYFKSKKDFWLFRNESYSFEELTCPHSGKELIHALCESYSQEALIWNFDHGIYSLECISGECGVQQAINTNITAFAKIQKGIK